MGCCGSAWRLQAGDHIKGVDLSGKVAIVTGGSAGIGFETAKALLAAKCKVIILARDGKRLDKAAIELHEVQPQEDLLIREVCDLSSPSSIRSFVTKFRELKLPLHYLINNAGFVSVERKLTNDKIEKTFATNHLGHFLLTTLLLDVLIASKPSRVVMVSSNLHAGPSIDFSVLPAPSEETYTKERAYQQSKLANVLFARELSRRYSAQGVSAFSLHPGVIATDLSSDAYCMNQDGVACWLACCLKSASQGAATTIYCALAPSLEKSSGCYFVDSQLSDQMSSDESHDENVAKKLWEVSEKMVSGGSKEEEKKQ